MKAKLAGLSDLQIAHLRNLGDEGENTIRELRWTYGLRPVYKTVDAWFLRVGFQATGIIAKIAAKLSATRWTRSRTTPAPPTSMKSVRRGHAVPVVHPPVLLRCYADETELPSGRRGREHHP